jgi:probable selenium-dependent hydroxylase accessory protein YqeC
MDLATALELGSRELISFVGAGGKKTAMHRLVDEARTRNLTVGYTTTAHMPPPSFPLVVADSDELIETLHSRSDSDSDPALNSDPDEYALSFAREQVVNPERVDEKVSGFAPSVVDRVFQSERFEWLVVKADGARMRELKAPGEDEPQIPEASTRTVPVASVHAVGSPLSSEQVHRVQRMASLVLEPGATITPEAVGTVLAHPDGGCKNVPPDVPVVPLVNKADTHELRETARQVIETAIERNERIERGLVASLRQGYIEIIDK